MNKLIRSFIIIFICMFFFSNAFCASPIRKKTAEKQKIEFTTKDGFILVGDLYLAPKTSNKPLIICLHSFGVSAISWESIAKQLRNKGYNVLAMDLRGHGRSVYNSKLKVKSRYQFTIEDWQRLPRDVIQSLRYVKENYASVNVDQTYIVGSDVGATVGLLAALAFKNAPEKIVIISPVKSFKGLNMPYKSVKFYNSKVLYVISKNDKTFGDGTFQLKTPPTVKQYPYGGLGMQLIKSNLEAGYDIVNFLIN